VLRKPFLSALRSDSRGTAGSATGSTDWGFSLEARALFAAAGTVVDTSDRMQGKPSRLLPLALFLALPVTATNADEYMSMKVSPLTALAPVNLRVSVRVEPDADNRVLTIVADSGDFYRSSLIQLEGDRAPKTYTIEYPNVPGGNYDITSVLVNGMGRERASVHQMARVVPVGGEP
jgi:hypothetical protein